VRARSSGDNLSEEGVAMSSAELLRKFNALSPAHALLENSDAGLLSIGNAIERPSVSSDDSRGADRPS